MRRQLYWLSDKEWRRIEVLLPRGRRGAHRVDDGRVISGVLHMLRSGARWRDCPAEYGPYTTIYNRFNRWSKQGIWEAIFYKLTGSSRCPLASDLPACLAVFHICGSPPADLRGPRFAIRLHRSGSAAKLADSNLPEQHVAR